MDKVKLDHTHRKDQLAFVVLQPMDLYLLQIKMFPILGVSTLVEKIKYIPSGGVDAAAGSMQGMSYAPLSLSNTHTCVLWSPTHTRAHTHAHSCIHTKSPNHLPQTQGP